MPVLVACAFTEGNEHTPSHRLVTSFEIAALRMRALIAIVSRQFAAIACVVENRAWLHRLITAMWLPAKAADISNRPLRSCVYLRELVACMDRGCLAAWHVRFESGLINAPRGSQYEMVAGT
jgi:hypothetical protein